MNLVWFPDPCVKKRFAFIVLPLWHLHGGQDVWVGFTEFKLLCCGTAARRDEHSWGNLCQLTFVLQGQTSTHTVKGVRRRIDFSRKRSNIYFMVIVYHNLENSFKISTFLYCFTFTSIVAIYLCIIEKGRGNDHSESHRNEKYWLWVFLSIVFTGLLMHKNICK